MGLLQNQKVAKRQFLVLHEDLLLTAWFTGPTGPIGMPTEVSARGARALRSYLSQPGGGGLEARSEAPLAELNSDLALAAEEIHAVRLP